MLAVMTEKAELGRGKNRGGQNVSPVGRSKTAVERLEEEILAEAHSLGLAGFLDASREFDGKRSNGPHLDPLPRGEEEWQARQQRVRARGEDVEGEFLDASRLGEVGSDGPHPGPLPRGEGERKPGRPKVLRAEDKRLVIAMLGLGVSLRRCAKHLGVAHGTIYNELKRDAAFARGVMTARMQAETDCLAKIHKAAERSWRAAAWLIERIEKQQAEEAEEEAALDGLLAELSPPPVPEDYDDVVMPWEDDAIWAEEEDEEPVSPNERADCPHPGPLPRGEGECRVREMQPADAGARRAPDEFLDASCGVSDARSKGPHPDPLPRGEGETRRRAVSGEASVGRAGLPYLEVHPYGVARPWRVTS